MSHHSDFSSSWPNSFSASSLAFRHCVAKLTNNCHFLLLCRPHPVREACKVYIENMLGSSFHRGSWGDTPSFFWEVRNEAHLFPATGGQEVERRLEKMRRTKLRRRQKRRRDKMEK